MIYLYKITNIVNSKIYIGQTNNPNLRWSQHKSNAKYNRGNQVITRAITKYGENNFDFEVIASCLTKENADLSEQDVILQYDCLNHLKGYNVAAGGNTTVKTKEVLQKISDGLKKHYETHDGWNKGGTLSEEWKQNISIASIGKDGTNIGKKFDDDWKSNISKSLKGMTKSEIHKQNLSDSHKGQVPINRKITFELAEQIRLEYKAGKITQKQLGVKYCLAQSTVFAIIKSHSYNKG